MHRNQYKAFFLSNFNNYWLSFIRVSTDTANTSKTWLTATCNSHAQSLFWFHIAYCILIYGTYGIDTHPVLKAMVWSCTAALNMSKIRNFSQEYDNLFCGRVPWKVPLSWNVRAVYYTICFEEFRGPLRELKQVTCRPRAASLTCLGYRQ
jgi:hypothetical protein